MTDTESFFVMIAAITLSALFLIGGFIACFEER